MCCRTSKFALNQSDWVEFEWFSYQHIQVQSILMILVLLCDLFWDGEFTWPFQWRCWWPPTIGDQVRSRLESPGYFCLLKIKHFDRSFGAYLAHSRGKWVAFVFGLKQKGGHKDRVWDWKHWERVGTCETFQLQVKSETDSLLKWNTGNYYSTYLDLPRVQNFCLFVYFSLLWWFAAQILRIQMRKA